MDLKFLVSYDACKSMMRMVEMTKLHTSHSLNGGQL